MTAHAPIYDVQRRINIAFDMLLLHRHDDAALWELDLDANIALARREGVAFDMQPGRAGIELIDRDGHRSKLITRPMMIGAWSVAAAAMRRQEVAAEKCNDTCNTSTDIEDYQT